MYFGNHPLFYRNGEKWMVATTRQERETDERKLRTDRTHLKCRLSNVRSVKKQKRTQRIEFDKMVALSFLQDSTPRCRRHHLLSTVRRKSAFRPGTRIPGPGCSHL